MFVLIRTTIAIASARRLTLHHYRWALPIAIHIVMHTIAIAIANAVAATSTRLISAVQALGTESPMGDVSWARGNTPEEQMTR